MFTRPGETICQRYQLPNHPTRTLIKPNTVEYKHRTGARVRQTVPTWNLDDDGDDLLSKRASTTHQLFPLEHPHRKIRWFQAVWRVSPFELYIGSTYRR